jgi:hypothetical protein
VTETGPSDATSSSALHDTPARATSMVIDRMFFATTRTVSTAGWGTGGPSLRYSRV